MGLPKYELVVECETLAAPRVHHTKLSNAETRTTCRTAMTTPGGASLIRNTPPVGPYSNPMPMDLE